jgi:hypothetical protein
MEANRGASISQLQKAYTEDISARHLINLEEFTEYGIPV